MNSASRVAAEHLYGANVVLAALSAGYRNIHRALVRVKQPELLGKRRSSRPEWDEALRVLAQRNIPTKPSFLYELDKLSDGRPHNGLVLEVSPLEVHGIRELCRIKDAQYKVIRANGSAFTKTVTTKFPLWVYMDGIVDPQNVGAILRTCRFLGVDGVAYRLRGSPSLSPTVSKASAGALEWMVPHALYSVASGQAFLQACRDHGWEVLGAGKRPSVSTSISGIGGALSTPSSSVMGAPHLGHVAAQTASHQLKWTSRPRILVLGNEHAGIRTSLSALIDRFVWVPRPGMDTPSALVGDTVDSLNVSVAVGMLLGDILSGASRGAGVACVH